MWGEEKKRNRGTQREERGQRIREGGERQKGSSLEEKEKKEKRLETNLPGWSQKGRD